MHAKSPFFTFATNSLKILAIFYRVHFISAAIFSTDRRSIARTDSWQSDSNETRGKTFRGKLPVYMPEFINIH